MPIVIYEKKILDGRIEKCKVKVRTEIAHWNNSKEIAKSIRKSVEVQQVEWLICRPLLSIDFWGSQGHGSGRNWDIKVEDSTTAAASGNPTHRSY